MSTNHSEREISEGVQQFIEHMLITTMRLVRVQDEDSLSPKGVASGFFLEREGRCYLVTAAHVFKDGKWVLETRETRNNQVLQLKISTPTLLVSLALDRSKNPKRLDVAWRQMDSLDILDDTEERSLDDSSVLPIYRGPLNEEPVFDEAYGFASWSNAEYHKALGQLRREAAYEVGMEYDGTQNVSLSGKDRDTQEVHRFKLSREHQGNSYYKGASGSPIAGSDGKIVSVLIGGSDENDILYGFPIQTVCELIGIQ
ncbi:hypothetical protein [Salinibacter ruber]|jgi:hypothetical protein|uniref:hypothetical protein n=1 Tax=Salinibacter ruber TaxID=146919 RepID=UPI002167B261|nr:hypothetical protein [Salinibacter ruber]MCS4135434.1 hypothetical protein [Salinibacter ruber]